jgi:hypothetical protein
MAFTMAQGIVTLDDGQQDVQASAQADSWYDAELDEGWTEVDELAAEIADSEGITFIEACLKAERLLGQLAAFAQSWDRHCWAATKQQRRFSREDRAGAAGALPHGGRMPTTPRISGTLFVSALEITSLYLQGDDRSLARKLDELSEHEVKIIRHQLACLVSYLRTIDEQEHIA